MSGGPNTGPSIVVPLTEGPLVADAQLRHRGANEFWPCSAWANRGSLLLNLPDTAAIDRHAARPFRAMLIGLVIVIGALVITEAAMEWMNPPRAFTAAKPWLVDPKLPLTGDAMMDEIQQASTPKQEGSTPTLGNRT